MPATKTQSTKVADKDMARVQTFILDALVPLTSIVEADAKGDKVTNKQAVNVTKTAIELIGNVKEVIYEDQNNVEDSNFCNAKII